MNPAVTTLQDLADGFVQSGQEALDTAQAFGELADRLEASGARCTTEAALQSVIAYRRERQVHFKKVAQEHFKAAVSCWAGAGALMP